MIDYFFFRHLTSNYWNFYLILIRMHPRQCLITKQRFIKDRVYKILSYLLNLLFLKQILIKDRVYKIVSFLLILNLLFVFLNLVNKIFIDWFLKNRRWTYKFLGNIHVLVIFYNLWFVVYKRAISRLYTLLNFRNWGLILVE